MAKTCAFCGKSVGFWSQQNLACGGTSQLVCPECREKYGALSERERAEYLLQFGHPEHPDQLKWYLVPPEERAQMDREAKRAGLTCLRCGGEMLRYGRRSFPLGDEGLFGTVLRDGWMTSWLEVDILRCEKCGRAEFFLPQPPELDRPGQPEETVVCPVCGTEHSASIGCPACALNAAYSGRVHTASPAPDEKGAASAPKGKKPPWER